MVSEETIRQLLKDSADVERLTQFTQGFLFAEWDQVVYASQLRTWSEYRDVPRLGRRTRLREPQHEALWRVFARALSNVFPRNAS